MKAAGWAVRFLAFIDGWNAKLRGFAPWLRMT
jgi:hypothetical protein